MISHIIYIGGDIKKSVFLLLCVFLTLCLGKPLKESDEGITSYQDTEEIINAWNNDDSYYDYSEEDTKGPVITYLPPVLVELEVAPTTTTTTTTTNRPVYFPNTDIELGPLFEQVGKARRNEIDEPVELPVPYIVWAQDPSEREEKINYWKKFYNTMYKVD